VCYMCILCVMCAMCVLYLCVVCIVLYVYVVCVVLYVCVGERFQSLVGWDVGGPGEGRMPVGEGAGLPAGRGESARARHPLRPLSHSLSFPPSFHAG